MSFYSVFTILTIRFCFVTFFVTNDEISEMVATHSRLSASANNATQSSTTNVQIQLGFTPSSSLPAPGHPTYTTPRETAAATVKECPGAPQKPVKAESRRS